MDKKYVYEKQERMADYQDRIAQADSKKQFN